MTTFRATLTLHTAFGTPLAGDTLFGQLCWTAREHLGEAALKQLLEGYTQGSPWLVVSDGFPSGYLPKPTVPQPLPPPGEGGGEGAAQQRKAEKAKRWIPLAETGKSLRDMLAVNDNDAFGKDNKPVEAPQMHNTLNRLTGATGTGEFAPYSQSQISFAQDQRMDMYCVLDESRMSLETFQTLLEAIGSYGFGRDASIGLGKFTVESAFRVGENSFAQDIENCSNKFEPTATVTVGANSFAQHPEANAWLTLAPCAPQGQGFDGEKSFWRVITRFGRHGNLHGISGKPFKNPVLLAATGAVFVPQDTYTPHQFIGQGLGGKGQLSKIEPATVHQGYAPVIGIRMDE